MRNLTPTLTAPPADLDSPQPWKIVGLELAHKCTFCGGKADLTLGCPDNGAPILWQIGVCSVGCADILMTRFSAVKNARIAKLGFDMRDAAGEVRDARKRASEERYERESAQWYRGGLKPKVGPEVEADAARRLAEEEAIARKYDMPPGWSVEEDDRAFARALQKVRQRR